MGAKSGRNKQESGIGKAAGRKRLIWLIVFGASSSLLFVGFAVAQGIGQPSVPSGDVALVKGSPATSVTSAKPNTNASLFQQTRAREKKRRSRALKNSKNCRTAALGEMLQTVWIAGEAEELGISVTEKQIATELAKIKKTKFPTEAAFKEFLKTSHFTAGRRQRAGRSCSCSARESRKRSTTARRRRPHAEIADYLRQKPRRPSTRSNRAATSASSSTKTKPRSKRLRKRSKPMTRAANWKKVAEKYSRDPTSKRRPAERDHRRTAPGPLKKAIFGSATGEIVGPVKFQENFLVIEVVKLNPEKVRRWPKSKLEISKQLTEQTQQSFFAEFVSDYQSKWRSRTFCASGFEIEQCANFKGSGHPPAHPPPATKPNPKTPAKECPAPVEQTKPALPGTTTLLKPQGERLVQRPQPRRPAEATAGAPAPAGAARRRRPAHRRIARDPRPPVNRLARPVSVIASIHARQILDSRGNPTVEVEVVLESGARGLAAVPSGASTGEFEAVELRDGGERLGRQGRLAGGRQRQRRDRRGADRRPRRRAGRARPDDDRARRHAEQGPPRRQRAARRLARRRQGRRRRTPGQPLYRYLAELYGGGEPTLLPVPMMNVLNGGAHADNSVDFQEFMVVPAGASSFSECLRIGDRGLPRAEEVALGPRPLHRRRRRGRLRARPRVQRGGPAGRPRRRRGAPATSPARTSSSPSTRRPARSSRTAPTCSSTRAAASRPEEMAAYWEDACSRYPIVSIEDGMDEEDWDGWKLLTERLGERVQLVGDDLFVTNPERLRRGIELGVGNSILVKVNQIGTLTETLEAIRIAREAGYTAVISHRSGETEDTTIADLAVATGAGQIKTGAPSRSDRVAKYNRLLRIEEELGSAARVPGPAGVRPAPRWMKECGGSGSESDRAWRPKSGRRGETPTTPRRPAARKRRPGGRSGRQPRQVGPDRPHRPRRRPRRGRSTPT